MKAEKQNHYGYNKRLRPLAHTLRYTMTKAEACLWKYVLRAAMMKGYTFRRQRPVLKYIADFLCKELMLVIEADGITHHFEEIIRKDEIKQKALEQAGFTVLRFTDDEVLKGIENVRRAIEDAVEVAEVRLGISPSARECPRTREKVPPPPPASGGQILPHAPSQRGTKRP